MNKTTSDMLASYKGIIFDIDGTMVKSMKYHLESWQEILERYNCHMTIKEISEKLEGTNEEIAERLLGGKYSEMERTRIWKEKELRFRKKFNPKENIVKGLVPFLDELQNKEIPLAIGSSAPVENVEYILTSLGIKDRFQAIVHAGDVDVGKPDPEVFIKAASLMKLQVQDCLVFEDSHSGAEASFRAGSRTIIVTTTQSKSAFKDIGDIVMYIKDYSELLDNKD